MPKRKVGKSYIVVFQDEEGNVLKTAFVEAGKSAKAPEIPKKKSETEHHEVVFTGWDHDIQAVNENLVVKPVYQNMPKKYIVMYFKPDGGMLGMESVPYSQPAKAEYQPTKEGDDEFYYEFEGWDADLTHIEKDTMARPVFTQIRRTFSVGFYNYNGRLIRDQIVPYGEDAIPPEDVSRASDKTYRYIFRGWDSDYTRVTEERKVYAEFDSEFIDYKVTFTEEGSEIGTRYYHYQEPIRYPERKRKGYDLTWTPNPTVVEDSVTIDASYTFSNPKDKIAEIDGSTYQITNPSVTDGAVACLSYQSDDRTVEPPAKVRIGDYYYKVTRIEKAAFASCPRMERLVLPEYLVSVGALGLAGCSRLREVVLGKRVKRIQDQAFLGDAKLKDVTFTGKGSLRFTRRAFDGLGRLVRIHVPTERYSEYAKKLPNRLMEQIVR